MQRLILVLIDMTADNQARYEAAGFRIRAAITPAARAAAIADGHDVAVVVTNGATGLHAHEMAQLPQLEIICVVGAGFENVDLDAATAQNITVTNGAGTNDVTVADHAMALLLASVRAIPQADARIKQGVFDRRHYRQPMISGKRLGMLGLGTIGLQIAQRAHRGFDMPIGYHTRAPRADVPHAYYTSAEALAAWADFLVIATPGGSATRHLVDAAVLSALGPDGHVVNIARGSVIDTAALIAALEAGAIAGAALDVVDGEPDVPAELTALPNVIFTPHIAGRSPEAIEAVTTLVLKNLAAHFAGEPVLTPVNTVPRR